MSRKAQRLLARAHDAAALRGYHTHPDVAALEIEKSQRTMSRLLWVALLGGLAYTMVNVQQFAAAGEPMWSPLWTVAWVLDPIVSLVLIGVLRGEQVMARYQVTPGVWVRRAKWLCLAATYVMNTWSAWAGLDAAGVVLHSVPPAIVFVAAEVLPQLRSGMTDATWAAHAEATRLRKEKGDSDTTDPLPEVSDETPARSWLSRMVVVSGRVGQGDTGRVSLSQGDTTTSDGDTGHLPDSDHDIGQSEVSLDAGVASEAASDMSQVASEAKPRQVVSLSDMAERDRQVIAWLREDPDMSGAEIGRRLGVVAKTGQRLKAKLSDVARQQTDKGDTRPVSDDQATGDTGHGRWRVKELKGDSDTAAM